MRFACLAAPQDDLARHWQGVAQRSGVPGVWDAMLHMVERVEPALVALQAALPADFPARTAETVFDGVRRQLTRWQQRVTTLQNGAAQFRGVK